MGEQKSYAFLCSFQWTLKNKVKPCQFGLGRGVTIHGWLQIRKISGSFKAPIFFWMRNACHCPAWPGLSALHFFPMTIDSTWGMCKYFHYMARVPQINIWFPVCAHRAYESIYMRLHLSIIYHFERLHRFMEQQLHRSTYWAGRGK